MAGALLAAVEMGYTAKEGKLYNPDGVEIHGGYSSFSSGHYRQFSIRRFNRCVLKHCEHVYLHHLVAYQKFGEQIFEPGLQIRHLNGDHLDNREENIGIGSPQDNAMDRKPEDRKSHSLLAAARHRKFTNEQVDRIRARYQQVKRCGYRSPMQMVMTEFGITSTGTVSYILHHDYATDKVVSDASPSEE
jgi:hypothetical protein